MCIPTFRPLEELCNMFIAVMRVMKCAEVWVRDLYSGLIKALIPSSRISILSRHPLPTLLPTSVLLLSNVWSSVGEHGCLFPPSCAEKKGRHKLVNGSRRPRRLWINVCTNKLWRSRSHSLSRVLFHPFSHLYFINSMLMIWLVCFNNSVQANEALISIRMISSWHNLKQTNIKWKEAQALALACL